MTTFGPARLCPPRLVAAANPLPVVVAAIAGMIATIAAEGRFDASPDLHRISAPTLIVAGERDRFYGPDLFRETAARIPDARLCLYPGRGHATTLAHKRAMREIVRFLTNGDRPTRADGGRTVRSRSSRRTPGGPARSVHDK